MIVPAPVEFLGDGRLRLDAKFLTGMGRHVAMWDGPVEVVLWTSGSMPFGRDVTEADLGFGLRLKPAGTTLVSDDLAGAALICVSADMAEGLDLPVLPAGAKLVYVLEYTLRTRLDILALDRDRGALRRLRSALWLRGQERRRLKALAQADAVQFNGYPAAQTYGHLVRDGLTYLDGRMTPDLMATPAEMTGRMSRLRSGAPLRLVHSGRLEPMKGAQDLVPVAAALAGRGVDFTLDIFGTGSLEGEIARGAAAAGLGDRVRLHAPVPFETGLVPWMRDKADLFLSCHRQGDPSCTYLESMGCGLAIAGYDNEMWAATAPASGGGWTVPMGLPRALAEVVAKLDADREALVAAGERALAFAAAHDFETEFRRRMDHLARVLAGAPEDQPSG